jgi:DNA-binding transcriptional LysR family regulator
LDFQVAYSSGSLSGLLALARSGQAIAVLTRAAVPPDLRVLPVSFGLPELPSIDLTIEIDEKRASMPARAFQTHVSTLLPAL